ncbi:hypothetical protein BYT27DRAFT_7342299 [Phlegmacium glaucopus]|nr:hypothetical protein BYT27DRAFT_7342299 [Phlegmacium glaucopus]
MAQSLDCISSRSGSHDSSVDLPYELECYIFKLTAGMYLRTAPKLCRISKYVQEWAEAVIYETVVLSPYTNIRLFLRTLRSRPPIFFGRNVKKLHITKNFKSAVITRIVSACSGVTDFICWTDPTVRLIQFLVPQRLQKLSITMEAFWGTSSPSTRRFDPDIFPHLSHLEIVDPTASQTFDWNSLGLCELPAFAHMAFSDLTGQSHSQLLKYIRRLLRDCQHLLALVVFSREGEDLVKDLTFSGEYIDPRFLVFFSPMQLAVQALECLQDWSERLLVCCG